MNQGCSCQSRGYYPRITLFITGRKIGMAHLPHVTWVCVMSTIYSVISHPSTYRPTWPNLVVQLDQTYKTLMKGSDSGLYNPNLFEGDIKLDVLSYRNAVPNEDQLWPDASIIYTINPGIGCPSSAQCEMLMKAMRYYHDHTCVRFKEWTGEPNRIDIYFNPDDGACWSMVGRSSLAVQKLSLGYRCWYLGIVLHELGHTIGFWHEMTRFDRDKYIRVLWENIQNGSVDQFSVREKASTLNEPFDYKSIMLYDEFAFTKRKGYPTVEVIKENTIIGPIWNKTHLSERDIIKITKLYHCNGNQPKPTFPRNVHCSFNEHTCGFKNGGRVAWKHHRKKKSSHFSDIGYVFTTYQISDSTPGHFVSINYHAMSKNHFAWSETGCVRFWYQIHGDGQAQLVLFQTYLTHVTELKYDPEDSIELWQTNTNIENWTYVELSIYIPYSFKLIFESQFEDDNEKGIILLDNLDVLYSSCESNQHSKMLHPPSEVANEEY